MVWKDPIVEEIHQARADIMKEHNDDLHKLFEHLRQRQQTGGRKVAIPPCAPTDTSPSHPE